EPAYASSLEHRLFAEIVATEKLIEFAPDPTTVDSGRHASAGAFGWTPHIERVAVVAGIAKLVTRCHGRGVGGGEWRDNRMRSVEIDADPSNRGDDRCCVRSHAQGAQAVGHE